MSTAGRTAADSIRVGAVGDFTAIPQAGYSGLTIDMAEGTRDRQGGGIGTAETTGHTEGTVSFSCEDNAVIRDLLWPGGPGQELHVQHIVDGVTDVYALYAQVSWSFASAEAVLCTVEGDIVSEPT